MVDHDMLAVAFKLLVTLGYASGVVVAQVAQDPGVGNLVQYGVLGLLVIGFITGWVVPGRVALYHQERADRAEAVMRDQVIPLLARAAAIIERAEATPDAGPATGS